MRWALLLLLIVNAASADPLRMSGSEEGALDDLGAAVIALQPGASGDVIATWRTQPFTDQQRFTDDASLELIILGGGTGRIALLMRVDPWGNMSAIGAEQHLNSPLAAGNESFAFPVAGEIVPAGYRLALLLRIIETQGATIDGQASSLTLPLEHYLDMAPGQITAGPEAAAPTGPAAATPVPAAVPVPAESNAYWGAWVSVSLVIVLGAIVLSIFLRKTIDAGHWVSSEIPEAAREATMHPASQRDVNTTAQRICALRAPEVLRPRANIALQEAADDLADVVPSKLAAGRKRLKLHYDPDRCIGVTAQNQRCRRKPMEMAAACSLHAGQRPGQRTPPKHASTSPASKKRPGPWA